MSTADDKLIEELYHNASASGGRPLERRLAELAVWYYKNRHTIDQLNLAARQNFLDKAMWIFMEVFALGVDRMHVLEDKGKARGLWIPRGIKMNGSEGSKEFG